MSEWNENAPKNYFMHLKPNCVGNAKQEICGRIVARCFVSDRKTKNQKYSMHTRHGTRDEKARDCVFASVYLQCSIPLATFLLSKYLEIVVAVAAATAASPALGNSRMM